MHFTGKIATAFAIMPLAVGLVSQPAHAQDSYYGPGAGQDFQAQLMGGYSGTSGNAGTYLMGGWAVDGGFIYWLEHDHEFGLRTDLSYSHHQATDQFLAFGQEATGLQVDDGWGGFSAISTGLVIRAPGNSWAHVYGLAQIGLSHVDLRLVQTFFVPGFYCDPFFDYCDYPIVGEDTVYSYHTNRLSWNVGVGVDFPSFAGQSWFIEAQYRRIEVAPHPFEYWPIMVGLRF